MAPMIQSQPFLIVSLLGAVHLIIAFLVCRLPDEPTTQGAPIRPLGRVGSSIDQGLSGPDCAQDGEPGHPPGEESHPPVYIPLLMVFRMMLIASYVILSVMVPLMQIGRASCRERV